MVFDILTTFPNSFSFLNESIPKRAQEKGLIKINIHNLRKWATDRHETTDDTPFGGGAGMLMKVEPIYKALKELGIYPNRDAKTRVILMSARGKIWAQNLVKDYAESLDRIVIICGHYEGVDHRVVEHLIDDEISVGNYVLSAGELASMIIIDSVSRLVKGVLGNENSLLEESHNDAFDAEYPQYTRPASFKTDEGEEWGIPDVLLSGDHKKIADWRKSNAS